MEILCLSPLLKEKSAAAESLINIKEGSQSYDSWKRLHSAVFHDSATL